MSMRMHESTSSRSTSAPWRRGVWRSALVLALAAGVATGCEEKKDEGESDPTADYDAAAQEIAEKTLAYAKGSGTVAKTTAPFYCRSGNVMDETTPWAAIGYDPPSSLDGAMFCYNVANPKLVAIGVGDSDEEMQCVIVDVEAGTATEPKTMACVAE